jgi:hypothetical protein
MSGIRVVSMTALILALGASEALAQVKDSLGDSLSVREATVRRQRKAAGVRTGAWGVQNLATGPSFSQTPAFEGYLQRGLDRHLVIESSAGFWYRSERTTTGRNNAYIIPMMTSLKLYPATGPEHALEPFISAGVGFTMGIDDRDGGGGLAGSTGGTALMIGLGAKGGAGVEYRLGSTFGVTLGAGYQYIRFFEDMGGARTYRGTQVFGGLTYRFQY